MKTRRSQKSFENPPPRRPRKKMLKKKSDNAIEEPIVVLDSGGEEECERKAIPLPSPVPVKVNNNHIEVIDIDDSEPNVTLTCDNPEAVDAKDDQELAVDALVPAITAVTTKDEGPPVIDIIDEAEDDVQTDDIEVVGVVISSKKRSASRLSARKSLKRKLSSGSGGVSSLAQIQVKKAKLAVRNGSFSRQNPERYPLHKISNNSRRIQKPQQNYVNRGGHPLPRHKKNNKRNLNTMNRNRTREFERELILRTVRNDVVHNNGDRALNNNNFSFESVPFAPVNTSTPAPARNRRNDIERAQWLPSRQIHGTVHGGRQIHGPTVDAPPGYNIMDAAAGQSAQPEKGTLRPIVIDGSNVAVSHGKTLRTPPPDHVKRPVFSSRGIKICVDYFLRRGHKEVVVFVPRYRLKGCESTDPPLLEKLEKAGHVRFTPSRDVGDVRIASYDDLFVLEYAREVNGIVISNDNFRDLFQKPHLQETIINRLLQFTFVTENVIMFPEDPMGRTGPSLDEFLRF